MQFKYAARCKDGKWFIGEHMYDENGFPYVKPLVDGFNSQIEAYLKYGEWLKLCPINKEVNV